MQSARVGRLLMSLPEIAALAGVQRPVVTNWRRRHANFPPAVDERGPQSLFDAHEVCTWLVATGRAEKSRIDADLCMYALSALGLPLQPRELVSAVTALLCLRHLDDEPLTETTLAELRDRAQDADPDDELLRSEVAALPASGARLPAMVDDLVEAAWGCSGAFERIMAARGRFAIRELAASAMDGELARLMARLSGAPDRASFSGSLVLADPAAGAGDLLVALLSTLAESCAPVVVAAESDPYLARLLRRRLRVLGVQAEDLNVQLGVELTGRVEDPDVVVTQVRYQPKEHRVAAEVLTWIDEIGLRLDRNRTAVVLGPADVLTGPLDKFSSAERERASLLSGGTVEAVICMPGGLVPFRPGYETALWVLASARDSSQRGRVLLGDISNRPLTPAVTDALVTDVVTWRRPEYRPGAHTLTYCVQADIATLVASAAPLVAAHPPTVRERISEVPATVARVAELERALGRLADPRTTPRAPVRTGLQVAPTLPRRASVGTLLRDGTLTLVQGARISPTDITTVGQHPLFGVPELAGRTPRGARTLDRVVLAERYPRVALTEPGDVVVTVGSEFAVFIDHRGFAVVEYPARALRVPAAKRDHLPPRVLAALLAAGGPRHSDHATRPTKRLHEWEIPLLDRNTVREADAMLTRLDERRAVAEQELATLEEIARIAATGLASGTLTVRSDQEM